MSAQYLEIITSNIWTQIKSSLLPTFESKEPTFLLPFLHLLDLCCPNAVFKKLLAFQWLYYELWGIKDAGTPIPALNEFKIY